METFVGCQRASGAAVIGEECEECRVVAYESQSSAASASSTAAILIKLEPSDDACGPEMRRAPRGSDMHTEECTLPEEANSMAASRKRGAPSESDAPFREFLQACPGHIPGVRSEDEAGYYNGSNVAFLQHPMFRTTFGIASINASARIVPPIPQSAPRGRVEVVPNRGKHTQKEKMSRETSRLLRGWFMAALESDDLARGYPSKAIKEHLAGKSGASKTQIQNWLQNARRRLRKSQDPLMRRSLRPPPNRPKSSGLSLFPPEMAGLCVRRGADQE